MATRRGFLGGVLGAAAAGPAVMQSGLQSAVGQGGEAFLGYGNVPKGGWSNYPDDLRKQLTDIRKMTSDDKRERYGVYRGDMRRCGINSLRSVSDVNKARINYEADVEANYQGDIKRILRALAGLEGN